MATPVIKIGQSSDGFSIKIDGEYYSINQEDDIAEELAKVFRCLGFIVHTFEDY